MSEINTPNISAQPLAASVDDHEWYYSETDKAPIAEKSKCIQFFKYHLLIPFYFTKAIAACLSFPLRLASKWRKKRVSLFFWRRFFKIIIIITCWIVGRGQRTKQISKFDKVLQQEKLDEWGKSSLKPPPSVPSRKRSSRKLKKLRTGNAAPHDLSDKDDEDFDDSSSETESVESGDASHVSNDEVGYIISP